MIKINLPVFYPDDDRQTRTLRFFTQSAYWPQYSTLACPVCNLMVVQSYIGISTMCSYCGTIFHELDIALIFNLDMDKSCNAAIDAIYEVDTIINALDNRTNLSYLSSNKYRAGMIIESYDFTMRVYSKKLHVAYKYVKEKRIPVRNDKSKTATLVNITDIIDSAMRGYHRSLSYFALLKVLTRQMEMMVGKCNYYLGRE